MNHNLEIQKILLKVETTPHPFDKIKLLKEAIQIADRHNDLDWGFDLRLKLVYEERNTSHCRESFPAFTWILNAYDSNPDYFDETEFLWEYKWMANSANRNATLPNETFAAIMEDLKIRFQRNGYSLRPYYEAWSFYETNRGNFEKAQEYINLADSESRDDMSNCSACELDTRVLNLLKRDKVEEALTKAKNLINKNESCYWMPFITFCNFAYEFSKRNDNRGKEFLEKALEEYHENDRYDSSVLKPLSQLLYCMYRTKDERFWNYFEKISEWELGAEDDLRMDFAMNVLPMLHSYSNETVSLNLSSKIPYYKSDNIYKLKDMYNYYKEIAYSLADKFDKRNGNDYNKNRISEIFQD